MNSYQSIEIPTLQAVKIIHSQYISKNKSQGEEDGERRWNNYLSLNVMMMSFSFMRALLFDFFSVIQEVHGDTLSPLKKNLMLQIQFTILIDL